MSATPGFAQFLQQPGHRIQYSYDFGDGWEHDIVLENRLNPEPRVQIPACLAGKGACPPEDCGGPWGYADLKDARWRTRATKTTRACSTG
jgi:hypothetical protein